MAADPTVLAATRRHRPRTWLVLLGVVIVVAVVVAAIAQRRRIDEFERTVARVQTEAQGVGDHDLDPSHPPTVDAAPPIEGARAVSVHPGDQAGTYVVDYEISMSGEVACVRITRGPTGAEVTEAEVACSDFTFAPSL